MARPKLQFWFEFASTYSYLSVMRIDTLAADAGVEVEWHPFWLGPIFKAQGWDSSPFNLYPVKGAYMWRDMERLCAARGLPFKRPDPFPQNSVLAARTALLALKHPEGPAFCRAVYAGEFGEGRSIDDPTFLGQLLSSCGLPSALVEEANSDAGKQGLRDSVAEAMRLGIFGAPSFIFEGELFWGDDRLEMTLTRAAA
ncbi:2-hydroxychromene-2-carboxylate isomerase [Seohaeicola zhoushanensis]|uniref:2-hydroxychromene-2-carboxylate isomerase n=1 Tax=Seohaeicola zhoushanensis TaxID=1569283 RepID=A0A8J3M9D9_9RHOB|nr:2-hydroxychromene-2-carboxylate isomerase [Seohaeicola zhoushanensis]GHF58709.1 2-hydroxychromene-2-carboxylate isomerase [Seohaeicola zhoushanensis]